jgi:hypothetical protein
VRFVEPGNNGNGGGGGYAALTFAPGMLTVGSDVPVTVGSGGTGGLGGSTAAHGGDGAPGSLEIDWN